jgi:hypothetical protein|tara:strand:- start:2 stop:418 length:417 start_codon:yes stop_codon:yes gene_type:complete
MYRFPLIVALMLTIYTSPLSARDVVSDYTDPILEHSDSRDEGLDRCKKAHVLGFYANFNRLPPVSQLKVMMQEAESEGYCYGYFAKGDDMGNHNFSCYGVTWTGGTEIDLYKKCDEEWKRSKKSYGEWLEKTHPEKYI